MAGSIVVEVRKALVAAIKTKVNDTSVSVTYGWSGDDDSRRESIFTHRPRATHDPAALRSGRNYRNEEMEFDVVILVLGVGKSPDENDTRALVLGTAVEETVADHKSNELGVAGLNWLRMVDMELNNRFASTGTITEITYTVRYSARLT